MGKELFTNMFGGNIFDTKLPEKDHPMWSWTGPEMLEATCSECLKKTWFEARFAKPILPKKLVCFYCGHEMILGYKEEEEKKDD